MQSPLVESEHGVTLVGGAPVSGPLLARALAHAPRLVAVDGGADRALRLGHRPEAVVGDLDSISARARAQLADRLHHIAEQDTTDFDKALRSVAAPFVLALGFSGARLDHGLSVLNALARHAERRCLILSGQDIAFLAPPRLTLRLPRKSRLSLFPLGPVHGTSLGLRWPINGLTFAPDARIGTSNEVSDPDVQLSFNARRMLVILPRARLSAVLDGLGVPSHARGG